MRFAVVFVALLTFAGAVQADDAAKFPLGQVPDGWTYRELPDFERRFENLPFEVKGILTRKLSEARTVSVYVTLLPLKRGVARLPASTWRWVDLTFVPQGIHAPRTYVLNEQQNIGPKQQWNFREAKVTRAGVPLNLAAFHTQNKFANIFLVLRQDEGDYVGNLGQLKELVSSLKWTSPTS